MSLLRVSPACRTDEKNFIPGHMPAQRIGLRNTTYKWILRIRKGEDREPGWFCKHCLWTQKKGGSPKASPLSCTKTGPSAYCSQPYRVAVGSSSLSSWFSIVPVSKMTNSLAILPSTNWNLDMPVAFSALPVAPSEPLSVPVTVH